MFSGIYKFFVDNYREHFVATVTLVVLIAVLFLGGGFLIGSASLLGFLSMKIGELILVALIVKVLLSLNSFKDTFVNTLTTFFTGKEYLSNLKVTEVRELVKYINKFSNGSYVVRDDEKMISSLQSAKKAAEEKGFEFFTHTTDFSKVYYAKDNMEISHIVSTIEMLKDKKFSFRYGFKTNNLNRTLPSFSQYEIGLNRFEDYSFAYTVHSKDGGSKLTDDDIEIEVVEDGDYEKKILIKSNLVLKKGEIFTLELTTSNKKEIITSSTSKPRITLTRPAALRTFNVMSESFKGNKAKINGGNLLFGEKNAPHEELTIHTETKDEENNIFYKRTSWSLYYDDIKHLENPEVELEIY